MRTNKVLVRLILKANRIGTEGSLLILRQLKHNSSLVILNLEDNNIETLNDPEVIEALSVNTTLNVLWLLNN